MQKILDLIDQNKDAYLEELKEVLRIPSISAQSEHKADVEKTAQWFKDHLTKIGFENAQVLETGGHPVVYADWLHAEGKPTVLIYGHYDVQSPDPLDEWETPPFEPAIRGNKIYARGVTDDKGQVFTHIKAFDSIFQAGEKPTVNIKWLIEGEEEIGGPSLDKFIEENQDLLRADVCVISDSHSLSETQPLICYGLKGLVYMQLDLQALTKDVHSGSYGGNVPNVAIELANIIAQLKDNNTQQVLIPGFYENMRELTADEITELENNPFTKESLFEETGAKKVVGLDGFSIAARKGAVPTLDVNGMHSGYTGEGAKTIIPAKASAKISMRIVPHQTSAEIREKFTEFVKKITPDHIDLKITHLSSGEPILMDYTSEYFKKAENALEQVFGNKPIYDMEGGSIPVTATLKSLLGIDSILMGFGLPDDGLHSPNEKMNVNMFYKGIKASALFFLSF